MLLDDLDRDDRHRGRGDRALGDAGHPLPPHGDRRTSRSGGTKIKDGEKVVLWYNSANRDEDFWDEPYRFDVRRTPNEHVGFGAGGPHFCLGANLARREIQVMFDELFSALPDIEATGEPEMLQSPFIHGIKHLTAEFTPK